MCSISMDLILAFKGTDCLQVRSSQQKKARDHRACFNDVQCESLSRAKRTCFGGWRQRGWKNLNQFWILADTGCDWWPWLRGRIVDASPELQAWWGMRLRHMYPQLCNSRDAVEFEGKPLSMNSWRGAQHFVCPQMPKWHRRRYHFGIRTDFLMICNELCLRLGSFLDTSTCGMLLLEVLLHPLLTPRWSLHSRHAFLGVGKPDIRLQMSKPAELAESPLRLFDSQEDKELRRDDV